MSFINLAQNGAATLNGPSVELGRWQFDESGKLCLQWRDEALRCAPVYAAGGSHYRFGEMDLGVLGSRQSMKEAGIESPRRLSLPIGIDAGESQAVGAIAVAASGPPTIVGVVAALLINRKQDA